MLLNIHILGIINYWVQFPANLLQSNIKYIYDNNKSINLSILGMKGGCNSIYTRVFAVSYAFVFAVSSSFIFAGSIGRILPCYYSFLSSSAENEGGVPLIPNPGTPSPRKRRGLLELREREGVEKKKIKLN